MSCGGPRSPLLLRGDDPPAPPAHGGRPPPIPPGGTHRRDRGAPTLGLRLELQAGHGSVRTNRFRLSLLSARAGPSASGPGPPSDLSLVISLVPERDCQYDLTDPIEWDCESPQGPRRPGRHRHTARQRAGGRAVPAVGRVAAGAGRLQWIGERGLPPRYRPVRTAAAPARDHRRSSTGAGETLGTRAVPAGGHPFCRGDRLAHRRVPGRVVRPPLAHRYEPLPTRSPTHAGWRRTSRRSSARSGGSTCQTGRRRIRASAGRGLRWPRWTPRRGRRSAS